MDEFSKTQENMANQVKELYDERDTCTDMLDNVTSRIEGRPKADVYLMYDNDTRYDDFDVVGVRVPFSYADCYKDLVNNYVPENSAKLWCLRAALWQSKQDDDNDDEDDLKCVLEIAKYGVRKPATGFRTRREYRTLSLEERNRFHAALNSLYHSNHTNVTCFALIHRMALIKGGAHGGNAFLPWHRAFITFFEEALRRIDDRVFLPYWDSSMDDNMAVSPALSVMWDNNHMGTGSGVVNSGPFAGWIARDNPLTRNVASGKGSLYEQSRIDQVMGYCMLADFHGLWERGHNSVHVWVGGTMAGLMAAADPVFWMHHAFVDYQWEKFRERQKTVCGIDPASDYPPNNPDKPEHNPEARMVGMQFLANEDGIKDTWTDAWYNYSDTPKCSNNCGGSSELFCDEASGLCVSEMRLFAPGATQIRNVIRTKRAATYADLIQRGAKPYTGKCSIDPYAQECAKGPPPRTVEQLVEALVNDDDKRYPLPPVIKDAEEKLRDEIDYFYSYPEEKGIPFFKPAPEGKNDCRTRETFVYDIVKALVTEKKITGTIENPTKGNVTRVKYNPN
ncbi:putative tyrosinase-like protein tyr-3 [Mya arenaria]|uniref:putative tyrosinase-like protein tyr-3 n=1 Tax=Mya arenaria TaxID=6604 RepID=UPI0022DEACB5|nr:putative tyrosinase-like protein tyr-3 [Mya arenaria]